MHLGLLVDLDAALVGAAAIAPGHRVVPRDRAGRVVQRAQDRRVAAAAQVDLRAAPSLTASGPTTSLSTPKCLLTSARQRIVRIAESVCASVKWPRVE